jgi:uncharacterized LabA/DUF88 family protein
MDSTRVAIFVDGANVDRASELSRIPVNYVLLKVFLARNRTVTTANYYNSKPKDLAEAAFYARVESAGFQLVFGPKKIRNRPQKQIDVMIAVDMISESYEKSFDVAVLVSGDGDLAPAVRRLVALRKVVEVASFDDPIRREFSWALKTAATRTIDLTANIQKIKM